MTIALELVVTLPKLEQPGLAPDVAARWQRFAARVAAHEQRHVDLYLEGAKKMKTLVEAALARPSSCADLQTSIRSIWDLQQAEIAENQERFHLEDEARFQAERAPLRTQIDANKAQLSTLESLIREADVALADLTQRIHETAGRIEAGNEALITARHELVERHNRIVDQRRALAEEYTRTRAVTNDLIEALNWTR